MTTRPFPIGTRQGFALVEALASLVILAMTSLLLMQGVGAGRRVWETTSRAGEQQQSIAAAQDTLRERLEHAFPDTAMDASSPYVRFYGRSDQLELLATPPTDDPGLGIRRLVLDLTAGGALTLASSRPTDAQVKAPAETISLLRDVRSLDIAYYGAAAPDNVMRWRPSWSGQPGLPSLIRVRLEFSDDRRQPWPDLLIHPQPNIDSGCVLQGTTGRCRGRA